MRASERPRESTTYDNLQGKTSLPNALNGKIAKKKSQRNPPRWTVAPPKSPITQQCRRAPPHPKDPHSPQSTVPLVIVLDSVDLPTPWYPADGSPIPGAVSPQEGDGAPINSISPTQICPQVHQWNGINIRHSVWSAYRTFSSGHGVGDRSGKGKQRDKHSENANHLYLKNKRYTN